MNMDLTINLDVVINSCSYGSNVVYESVKQSFKNGNIYLLKGENGSGKSTFFSLISGIILDYDGYLKLNGEFITKKNNDDYFDKYISYMPQKHIIFDDKTCLENILIPYQVKDKEKALRLLDDLGLKELANSKAVDLSEGEKQRLSFARTIYDLKPILLLDEITANLDSDNKKIIFNKLIDIAKTHLVIFATNENVQFANAINLYIKNKTITRDGNEKENNEIFLEQKNLKNSTIFSNLINSFKFNKIFSIVLLIFTVLLNVLVLCPRSILNSDLYIDYAALAKEHYVASSPAFYVNKDSIVEGQIPENEIYNLYTDNIVSISKNDYKQKGDCLSGVVDYSDDLGLEFVYGRAPTSHNEVIISDVCFEKLGISFEEGFDNSQVDRAVFSFGSSNKCKIVGVYKSIDLYDFEDRFSQDRFYNTRNDSEDNVAFIRTFTSLYRYGYAFKIETIFGYFESHTIINNECCLVLNKNDNYKYVELNYNGLIGKYYFPFIVTYDGDSIFESNYLSDSIYKKRTKMELLLLYLIIQIIGAILLGVVFYFANKKKIILLRNASYPKKRIFKNYIYSFSSTFILSFILSFVLSFFIVLIINNAFASKIIFSVGTYFVLDFIYLPIILLSSLFYLLVVVLILRFAIMKKNRNNEASILKE